MFEPIDKNLLPEALPLQRAIAERYNNPDLLEFEDFDAFAQELYPEDPGDRYVLVGKVRFITNQLAPYLGNSFDPQPGTAEHFRLFHASQTAINLLTGAAGRDGDFFLVEPQDVAILEKVFGSGTATLIEEMQKQHDQLKAGNPARVFVTSPKFATNPIFQGKVRQVEERYQRAFTEFNQQFSWEVPIPPLPVGGVVIEDDCPIEYQEGEQSCVRPAGSFDSSLGYIRMSAEQLMLMQGTTTLAHETNHLWLALALEGFPLNHYITGKWGYTNSPAWFREGLAVVSVGQMEEKKRIALPSKSPEALAKMWGSSLEEGAVHTNWEYYSAAVAVQALYENLDSQFVNHYIGVQNDFPYFHFEHQLLNLFPNLGSEEDFYRTLHAWSLAIILREHAVEEREAYLQTVAMVVPDWQKFYEDPKERDLLKETTSRIERLYFTLSDQEEEWKRQMTNYAGTFERFLVTYPDGPFAPAVHFLVGMVYHWLKDAERASKHFNILIANPEFLPPYVEESIFYEAVGRAFDGHEGAGALEDTYPYLTDSSFRGSLLQFIDLMKKQEEWERAREEAASKREISEIERPEDDVPQGCSCAVRPEESSFLPFWQRR